MEREIPWGTTRPPCRGLVSSDTTSSQAQQLVDVGGARRELTALDAMSHLDDGRVDGSGHPARTLGDDGPLMSSTSLCRPFVQSCSTVVVAPGSTNAA